MWFFLALFGAGVAYILTDENKPGQSLGCLGTPQTELCRQLAAKWGPKFGCPTEVLMVVGKIESGYRPKCFCGNARAMSRGGAYGMFQQTWATAKGHAAALMDSSDSDVVATMKKWTGSNPFCLFDPDLNAMFACRQLGTLSKRYKGNFEQTIGAYHQGAGKIDQMLKDGKAIPAELPPKGKEYVEKAIAVRSQVA